jgi:hypothetical protein
LETVHAHNSALRSDFGFGNRGQEASIIFGHLIFVYIGRLIKY